MSPTSELARPLQYLAMEIRVRGRVQGVGFRPTVWRMARELDLSGEVMNDGEGVLVRVGGEAAAVNDFLARIAREPPPLARIDAIETHAYRGRLSFEFRIAESEPGAAHTQVAPDAAICAACAAEIANPFERRFRYPFANCTHCGPRLSIVTGIPYDRANTTMAPFAVCSDCAREYRTPADRRFHARGDRLSCLRPEGEADPLRRPHGELRPALDPRRRCRRGRADQERRNCRRQGTGRISPRLRRDQRRDGGALTPVETPRDEAVRADGGRRRDHPPLLRRRRR